MNCTWTREQLSAYLDGELEQALASQVKAHLDGCDECRKELDGLREVTGMLHVLSVRSAPVEIEREVVSAIERDVLLTRSAPVRTRKVGLRVLNAAVLAAAAMLIALGVYLKFFYGESPTTPTVALTDSRTPARAVGETPAAPSDRGSFFADHDVEQGTDANGRVARGMGWKSGAHGPGGQAAPSTALQTKDYAYGKVAEGQAPPPADKGILKQADVAMAKPDGFTPVAPRDSNDVTKQQIVEPVPAPATPVDMTLQRPEVLPLQLASMDPSASRARILAMANSLDIRVVAGSLRAAETPGGEKLGTVGGKMPAPTSPPAVKARSGEEADKPASPPAPLREQLDRAALEARDDGEYEHAVTPLVDAIDKQDRGEAGTRVVVLAVPEEKLPQLVAKLAAEQAAPGEGGYKVVSEARTEKSVNETSEKSKEVREDDVAKALYDELKKYEDEDREREKMAQEHSGLPAGREKTKSSKTEEGVHTEAKPSETGAGKPADVKEETTLAKPAADNAKKGKNLKQARLVYVRIYLTRAAVAAEAEASKTVAPAAKPAPAAK